MSLLSIRPHAEFGSNNHRKDAHHFTMNRSFEPVQSLHEFNAIRLSFTDDLYPAFSTNLLKAYGNFANEKIFESENENVEMCF